MNDTYTYEDWNSGKVCLVHSSIQYNLKDKKIPIRVNWNQILKDDISKIKKEQKKIFEGFVKKRLDALIKIFSKKAKESQFLLELINEEIIQCREIMFGQISSSFFTTTFSNITFTESRISEIQEYIKKHKVEGKRITYEFIHSHSCIAYKYQKDLFQIEAESIFNFHNWLKEYLNETINPKKDLQEKAIYQNVENAENPHNDIFINKYGYQIFLLLKNILVGKRGVKSAHSFIYHKLIENKCIKTGLMQVVYMDFLKTQGVIIGGSNINTKSSAFQRKTYAEIVKTEEFQHLKNQLNISTL